MRISIIIPSRNEESYISTVLENILHQDYPLANLEIFVIDGKSNDNTCEIVNEYCRKYNNIYLLENPEKTVPHALNIGIAKANGSLILRMDAHASYPSDYISEIVKQMELNKADNVGGVIQTLPGDQTKKAKAIAEATSSIFGVGNSLFRINHPKIVQVDTVPFGCFRKEIFSKIGLFDEELTRNQDDEFNARLTKHGGKIFLIPHIKIKYYARPDLKSIFRMFYQYGYFKPLVNKKIGAPTSIRQLFPPAFIILLILCLGFPFINFKLGLVFLSILTFYILLDLFFSLKIALHNNDFQLTLWLLLIFPWLHISYGLGYIRGIPHIWQKQNKTKLSSFEISR